MSNFLLDISKKIQYELDIANILQKNFAWNNKNKMIVCGFAIVMTVELQMLRDVGVRK